MRNIRIDAANRQGHGLSFVDIDVDEATEHPDLIESIYAGEQTGVVVRRAMPHDMVAQASARLASEGSGVAWAEPNRGMTGGEIRVIGEAATPTFTQLKGPPIDVYRAGAQAHAARRQAVFGDLEPERQVGLVLGRMFRGRPAAPPVFEGDTPWSAFSVRALDPGEQIYAHHDNHYGLEVFQRLDPDYDRTTLLSWFVTLQAAGRGGELVVYGLWGSDPNPPMLPTRFLDTAALEARFTRHAFDLRAGDLVVFDSGRNVHRVSPVEGDRPRLTFGGFLTLARDRGRLAFWS